MRVPGMNLETDRDIAVWVRNVGLAMSAVAKATGHRVGAYCAPNGYVLMEVGDYDYEMYKDGKEKYSYSPSSRESHAVEPAEINLKGAPRKMP